MGKVGFFSYKELIRKNDGFEVYHLHRMNPKTDDYMIKNF